MVASPTRRFTAPRKAASVAEDRVRFLTAQPVDPGRVRGPILASWQRSRDLHVAADRIEQPYSHELDADTPLTRSAEPVLLNLRGQLDGQAMSIILTDPTGLVLKRISGDDEFDRYLDRVLLAPGFSYSEELVGTNGIGTALEVGGPAHVFGHEHYAENLERLACVGVPIRHPVSGRTVGAIDLTCWAKDAGPLLLTLAKTIGEQIRQALLVGAGAQQMELLQDYLRTCRRLPGIVFAISGDTVILNEHARTMLDPGDQAAMIAQASEALVYWNRRSTLVQLPSGLQARMYAQPVRSGDQSGGIVVHAKVIDGAAPVGNRRTSGTHLPLPGLVGGAPVWLRACVEAESASRSGEWLALAGEPGVGKMAILQAVQLRRQPVRRLVVVDTAAAGAAWSTSVRQALGGEADGVVIRHLDFLDGPQLRDLSAALVDARKVERESPLWVAVTLGTATTRRDLSSVLRLFPKTIEVPPLRLHPEDLEQLVPFFLGRLGRSEQLACSPEAMQVLLRGSWPGNAGQLLQMLRDLLRHRRTGTIQLDDLPPAVRMVSRRRLSRMESLERDAVVQSLVDAHGDKTKAAAALGMSRATIYRKIHLYGIVDPTP